MPALSKTQSATTLGANIARFRQKAKLSQAQLADALEVTASAVSRWETGFILPDAANIDKIAQLFGVSVSELFAASDRQMPDIKTRTKPTLREAIDVVNDHLGQSGLQLRAPVKPVVKPKKPRVLVIEDHASMAELLAHRLREGGFPTTVVTTFADAKIELAIGGYEIVVSDYIMDDDRKHHILEDVDRSHIFKILASGTVLTPEQLEAINAHVHLEKPFTPDDLLKAVSQCARKLKARDE